MIKTLILTNRDIDITLDYEANFNADKNTVLTEYPTSLGTANSDNVYNRPNEIRLNGSISNVYYKGNGNTKDEDRVKKVLFTLDSIRHVGDPVTIVGNYETFKNYVITNVSQKINKASNVLELTISFKEKKTAFFTIEDISEYLTPEDETDYSDETQQGTGDVETDDKLTAAEVAGATAALTGLGAGLGWTLGVAGAKLGSLIAPGVGTAIGAGAGAVVGIILSATNYNKG